MAFIGDLGKGSYARVIKAQCDDKNSGKVEKALKIQKPACLWEWYIFKEIQHRLKDSEKVQYTCHYDTCIHKNITDYLLSLQISYFVNMDNIHVFKNGSIISMEFANYGTLLSVILAYKKKWVCIN